MDINESVSAYSYGIKYIVVFSSQTASRPIDVCAHELLHSLGLPHTFDGFNRNALFTYEPKKTNNVMDYRDGRKRLCSLEQWQWKLVNIKIIR